MAKILTNSIGEEVKIFGNIIEDEALEQITRLSECGPYRKAHIRIMPDVHAGKGCTIGTTLQLHGAVTPNLVGVDIGCLDAQSEFLTPYGWKRMDEFQEGDLVLQYNPNNNNASFVRPNAYIKKKCDTFHVYKNSKGLNMAVSDEHRILIYKGFKKRGYAFSDMNYKELDNVNLSKCYYNIKTAFHIEQQGLDASDDELRLMVAISADARIRKNDVEFHFKKKRKIDRLLNILDSLNIEYKIYRHKDETVSISFKNYKRWTKNLDWVYKINQAQAKIVSKESLLWDGHSGYRSFFSSTHKAYADAIQFAFASCGIRASISKIDSKKENWNQSWIVTPTRNEYIGVNVKSRDEISEDGYKYCFNVDTSYFVARRGNNIFITGNCGMYVVYLGDVDIDLARFDRVVNEKIPSGFNIHEKPQALCYELDDLCCSEEIDFDMAQRSIGSLGGGNHFIELNEDDDWNKYLVIHSGSRNLGVRVCGYHQRIAESTCDPKREDREKVIADLKARGRESDIQATLNAMQCRVDKDLAYLTGVGMSGYLHDMQITQKYAELNRETIARLILAEFPEVYSGTMEAFHTVHNYIEMKRNRIPVLRKGAVAANAGQRLIIPMNMRDGSLLCRGKGNIDWNCSAPHGAGRLMSRKKAKEEISMADFEKSMEGIYSTSVCGETIDEAPQAYKPMQSIVDAVGDTVEVEKVIRPIYNFKAKN